MIGKNKRRGMKTMFVLTGMLLIVSLFAAETESIESFKLRAEKAKAAIAKLETENAAAKAAYEKAAGKIENFKAVKRPAGPVSGLLYDIKLKMLLGSGSRAAFRYDAVERKLLDARDEYFTYALVIIDGLNRGIQQCMREKCGKLAGLFSEREKWVSVIDYDSLFAFDPGAHRDAIAAPAGAGAEAKEDVALYYEKRLVQADQRINLLSEELELLTTAKKMKIKVDEARLQKLKERLTAMKASRREIDKKLK